MAECQLTSARLERQLQTRKEQDDRSDDNSLLRLRDVWCLGPERSDKDVTDKEENGTGDDGWTTTDFVNDENTDDGRDDTNRLTDGRVDKDLGAESELAVEGRPVDVDELSSGSLEVSYVLTV